MIHMKRNLELLMRIILMNKKSEKYTSLFHYWSRESIHNEDNEEMKYLFPTIKGDCYKNLEIILNKYGDEETQNCNGDSKGIKRIYYECKSTKIGNRKN